MKQLLKSLEEIEQAIDMMFQETDASKRTKSFHLLKNQFRRATDEIGRLERTNKRLRSELEQVPGYKEQQFLSSVSSYLSLLNK